jgi:hypothetical protein
MKVRNWIKFITVLTFISNIFITTFKIEFRKVHIFAFLFIYSKDDDINKRNVNQ